MLTVGAVLLVAAGLAYPGAAAEAPKGGTLRLGSPSDVDPDPARSYSAWGIAYATCAKLFNYPDKTGAAGTQVIPEVVRRTTVSRDRRVYTFDLKRTFRFSTGARVTAHSFADAFNRVANPQLKSPILASGYLREIVGAVAVMEGTAEGISGVQVLGRYRLQIRLTRPAEDFTARLTMPFFCPILPNTSVDPKGIDNPAGSGPYYVADWIPNRRIVLKRNPYYQGGRPANVDQIVITIGGSGKDCLRASEQDRIDLCSSFSLPPAEWPRLAKKYGTNRPGGQFFVERSFITVFLAFNHEREAFKGPGQIALKKAINYAIDRAEFAGVGKIANERTDQMLPPWLGRDVSVYPLKGADLATARKLYAQAKIKPPTLILYTGNDSHEIRHAQQIKRALKQIGIALVPKYYNSEQMFEKAGTRGEPYDLVFNGWYVDYADPGAFLRPLLDPDLRATGNTNYSYYSNPRVTARMNAADRLRGAARRKAWADLDADLLRTDPPWAPITHLKTREFISPSYGCFLNHPLYGPDLAAACKK